MVKKESLREEYERLMKELAEMNEDLNERQKEDLTADFYGDKAAVNYKIKRIRAIEEKLKAKRVS